MLEGSYNVIECLLLPAIFFNISPNPNCLYVCTSTCSFLQKQIHHFLSSMKATESQEAHAICHTSFLYEMTGIQRCTRPVCRFLHLLDGLLKCGSISTLNCLCVQICRGEGRGGGRRGKGEVRGGEGRGRGRGEVYTCYVYRNCCPQIDAIMS